ncbi:WD40 repeat-like protein [Aureobasidium pullulans]|nr:WD40 repeat-like protein [Aureobasidium pullulans]
MSPTIAKQLASSGLSLPADTYIYSLARTTSLCAAISSDDSLRYFDPTNLSLVHTVSKAHQGITCLKATSDGKGLVTAGRDGTVRCWDERGKSAGLQMTDPRGAGISALACRDTLIAAGTESTKEGLGDVSVLLWDTRNASKPLQAYVESHNDTVTQVAFHPTQQQTLLSGATDGLVSIFDTTISDEDDALVQVLNHYGAVHCAGFLNAEEVYAVSTDEQLSVYTLSKPTDAEDATLPVTAFGDVREQLKSSYVVDFFPNSPSAYIATGDTSSSRLTLVPLNPSWSFDMSGTMDFPGAHGDEIVRDFLIDKHNQRVITCGEDGQVRLWAQEAQSQPAEADAMEVDGKKKKRKDKKKDRFKPY